MVISLGRVISSAFSVIVIILYDVFFISGVCIGFN